MKRIFTAIDISSEVRQKVSEYIESLRREFNHLRIGWEKPEKLHLTLKFLGDIDERQLQNLINAVSEVSKNFRKFNLQISGTGIFPSAKNARILWLGIKDEQGSLTKLNESLRRECEKIGFAGDKRNFKPHLTIARLREPEKSTRLIRVHTESKFETPNFNVDELIVFQSRLQPNGSRYTPIFTADFI